MADGDGDDGVGGDAAERTSLEELARYSGRSVGGTLPAVTAAIAAGLLDATGAFLRWTSADARELALEWLRTGESVGVDPVGWLQRTAGHVERSAPDTAVELLQAALPLARQAQRPALEVDLARALCAAGRPDDAEQVCRAALAGPGGGMGAELRRVLVESLVLRGQLADAGREAAAAIRSAPDGGRSWFLAAGALEPLYDGRTEEAERIGAQAEALAVAEGDDPALALALRVRVRAAQQANRLRRAGRLSEQLVVVARRLPPAQVAAEAYLVAALTFSDVDWHPDALDLLRAGARVRGGVGSPGLAELAVHAYGGAILLWMGELERARAELVLAVRTEAATAWTVDARALLAVVHALRGEPAEAAAWLEEADRLLAEGLPVSSPARIGWARAEVALAGGRADEAVAHLRQAWQASAGAANLREHRRIGPYLLHLAGPDVPEAAHVVADLAALAGANPGVPSLEGVAAWAAGVVDRDASRAMAALELLRRSGRVLLAARCGIDAARLLDDRRHAAVLAAEVVASLDRAGAPGEAARATAALRAAGIAPAGRRGKATGGWASLTATEQRVATLVADGLSNPEVAARLFVATRTVSTHVSHILRKLGLRSRTELAVMVARTVGAERDRAVRAIGAEDLQHPGPQHPDRT